MGSGLCQLPFGQFPSRYVVCRPSSCPKIIASSILLWMCHGDFHNIHYPLLSSTCLRMGEHWARNRTPNSLSTHGVAVLYISLLGYSVLEPIRVHAHYGRMPVYIGIFKPAATQQLGRAYGSPWSVFVSLSLRVVRPTSTTGIRADSYDGLLLDQA